MSGYVVVANRTLGGEELTRQLGERIASDKSARFRVVVPVAPPSLGLFEVGGAMGGMPVVDLESREEAKRLAGARLDELLAWFRAVGVHADGALVTGDPVASIERAVSDTQASEVLISTLPAPLSKWLRLDLPQRLRRRVDVPLTVIESGTDSLGEAEHRVDDPRDTTPVASTSSPDPAARAEASEKRTMGESVYKIIELVGTSTESWEKAAAAAVLTASKSLRDLRVAEVVQLDLVVNEGEVAMYRAKVRVSFKYQHE